MMKRISAFLSALVLAVCLLLPFTETAHAKDLDYIHRYDVTVTPNAEDGSLLIQVDLRWEVLDEGPVTWLQIGVPNGSIRDVQALSDNIDDLSFDNSYMYVYLDRGYDDGEIFDFSYSWVQEYMYTLLDSGTVSYDYTPGWFDGARIGEMTVTWNAPAGATMVSMGSSAVNSSWTEQVNGSTYVYTGKDLSHGETLNVLAAYQNWPGELYWENSSENLPQDYYDDYYDDYYGDYYHDYTADVISMAFTVIVLVIVIVIVVNVLADGYHGGFGTPRYVCWHGLWYPAGPNGRPKPGSVGTKTKPKAPPRTRSSSGGFGGGSRGGGFGGGGFGGGSHCACASSCACACACACAGGGRAGCSAKNLYGAVQLDKELTKKLMEE